MKPHLLYLCHRMPWPPNKGEKIRGWHMLQHLRKRFDVHLGCLADEPGDMQYVPLLRESCASVGAFAVRRRTQMARALLAARPGRPLLPGFYSSRGLHEWVRRTLADNRIDRVVVCTVGLMPYVPKLLTVPVLLDAADIDSEKWDTYARQSRYPMRAVWAREARTLLNYERACAARADVSFFVSEAEAMRFAELAPAVADRIHSVQCGVDLESYDPAVAFANPYPAGMRSLVFTGNMDYWPNADAVIWFANEVLPALRTDHPDLAFWIAGANPGAAVRALATRPGVHVTGRVPDTKPYIAHAEAAVCPLRIARGIQNKVLEAMALAKPVIASEGAFEGIRARAGQDLLVAADAPAFRDHINAVLAGRHPAIGANARAAMVANYAWEATLARMDAWL